MCSTVIGFDSSYRCVLSSGSSGWRLSSRVSPNPMNELCCISYRLMSEIPKNYNNRIKRNQRNKHQNNRCVFHTNEVARFKADWAAFKVVEHVWNCALEIEWMRVCLMSVYFCFFLSTSLRPRFTYLCYSINTYILCARSASQPFELKNWPRFPFESPIIILLLLTVRM